MNAGVSSHLPLTIPALAMVLQGAALDVLIASLVLCGAHVHGMRVEPWVVTAAWSALGAGAALVYVLVSVLL